MDRVFCKSELEIVQALVAGKNAAALRRTGKTRGLLLAVHLRHGGKATIVVLNGVMRAIVRRWYREMFPRDVQPNVVIQTVQRVQGLSTPVYADDFLQMREEVQDLLYQLGGYFCGATS